MRDPGVVAALVVYESMFGSNKAVAHAIGTGLAAGGVPARVVEVGALTTESAAAGSGAIVSPEVHLLVVGGPTHALSMSRPSTRAEARREGSHRIVSATIGVREWLDALSLDGRDVAVAAFGTKVRRPGVPGGSAQAIAKQLRRAKGIVVAPPQDFGVAGVVDGLVEGELDAAHAWGVHLAEVTRV